jgi:hypothetical protein
MISDRLRQLLDKFPAPSNRRQISLPGLNLRSLGCVQKVVQYNHPILNYPTIMATLRLVRLRRKLTEGK